MSASSLPSYSLNDGYASLAAECVYSPHGYPKKEVAFYERHIREKGGKALELACGAGRHFIPLVKRGLDVEGSDASAETLRYARMAAELNGLGVCRTASPVKPTRVSPPNNLSGLDSGLLNGSWRK